MDKVQTSYLNHISVFHRGAMNSFRKRSEAKAKGVRSETIRKGTSKHKSKQRKADTEGTQGGNRSEQETEESAGSESDEEDDSVREGRFSEDSGGERSDRATFLAPNTPPIVSRQHEKGGSSKKRRRIASNE